MPIRVHIVAGYIHKTVCEQMIKAARQIESELGVLMEDVTWIPGSLEAPFAVKEIIDTRAPDAIVVFGVLEKGKTKHGEVIAHEVTRKLVELQLQYRMPMAVAIIGPGATLEYATSKAEYSGQKAMRAAVHMVKLKQALSSLNSSI